MDILVNHEKKIIYYVAPRCGTNFVRSVIKTDYCEELARDPSISYKDYTILKVVRNPYSRWLSWFCSFEWNDTIHPYWTVDDAEKWLEKFKIEHHNDYHTELQYVIYNSDSKFMHNNVYIAMENLNLHLGVLDTPHKSGVDHKIRYTEIPYSVRKFFVEKVPDLYRVDIEWIKNLTLWKKSS